MDDPWARVQVNDEQAALVRALADEWSDITRALSALVSDFDTGGWLSEGSSIASARAHEVERDARTLETRMWDIAR